MQNEVTINMREALSRYTIKVTITGVRPGMWVAKLGLLFIRLGCWVANLGYEEEPI